jgi:hypothetical protein
LTGYFLDLTHNPVFQDNTATAVYSGIGTNTIQSESKPRCFAFRLLSLFLRRPVFLHPGSLLLALRGSEGTLPSDGRWLGNGISDGSKRILRRTAPALGSLEDFYGSVQAVALSIRRATICSVGINRSVSQVLLCSQAIATFEERLNCRVGEDVLENGPVADDKFQVAGCHLF